MRLVIGDRSDICVAVLYFRASCRVNDYGISQFDTGVILCLLAIALGVSRRPAVSVAHPSATVCAGRYDKHHWSVTLQPWVVH